MRLMTREAEEESLVLGLRPVLYLPLWKRDGASFMSDDAYGHLCTANGCLWTPQGRRLDGTDDKLTVSAASSLDCTNALTVATWINQTVLTHGAIVNKFAYQVNGYLFKANVTGIVNAYIQRS